MSDGEKDDRALDRSVLALARQIADVINAGPREGRDILREMAIETLRERVRTEPAVGLAAPPAPASFNPFGIGLPLVFVGAILVFLFPPVGLMMFGTAAVMMVWGVISSLWARGGVRVWRQ